MNKIASYGVVLQGSPLWDEDSLLKLAADLDAAAYADAKQKAQVAAGLHGVSHLGIGAPLTNFGAGFVQRAALRDAGIDYNEDGAGTFGARHPILSGFVPVAGTVSAMNAADRIGRLERAARKSKK